MSQPSFDDWKAGVQQAISARWPGATISQIDPDAMDAAYQAGTSPVAFVLQGVPWIPAGPPVIRDPLRDEIVGMHSIAGLWFGFGLAASLGGFGLVIMCIAGSRAHMARIEAVKLGMRPDELEAASGHMRQVVLGLVLGIVMIGIFIGMTISSAHARARGY